MRLTHPARKKMLIDDFAHVSEPAPLFADAGGDNRARRAYLRALLGQWVSSDLTPKQRDTVELYYYKGLTMEEIGCLLSIAPSSVQRRLAGARRRLQKLAARHQAEERLQARIYPA